MPFELQPGAPAQRQIPLTRTYAQMLDAEDARIRRESHAQPDMRQTCNETEYIRTETRKAVKAAARDSVTLQKIAAQNEAARNKAERDRHAAMLLRPQEDF